MFSDSISSSSQSANPSSCSYSFYRRNTINREELAWAAGFFDGEGYIGFLQVAHSPLRISIAQIDRQVLDRFRESVGLGKVYGPYTYKNRPTFKPYFEFTARTHEPVQAIVAMLYQFLSPVKQAQCLNALRKYNAWYVTTRHYKTLINLN